jgi:hypothetical protein
MLTQINHWLEYASAAVDVFLLLRVLALRLQRTYLFLTLACILTVFFDVIDLSLPHGSPEVQRVWIYSNLLFAFVFPFAAWDVFEEIPAALTAFRRTVMTRSLTSIFMVSLFGLLVSIPAFNPDDPLDGPFLFRLMVVVSTGSATGCLSFFWAMRRAFRLQKIPFPHNTFVWMIFYGLTLASQIAIFFIIFVEEALGQSSTSIVGQVTETTAGLYGIAVTIWCGLRLKALPKDVPSASLNEPS